MNQSAFFWKWITKFSLNKKIISTPDIDLFPHKNVKSIFFNNLNYPSLDFSKKIKILSVIFITTADLSMNLLFFVFVFFTIT